MNDTTQNNMILWFFLALLVASCLLLVWLLWPFISVIILAIVIAGIFVPLYKIFNRKLNATLSSLVTCALIFCILFVPVSFFVGVIANEAYNLYLSAKSAVEEQTFKELINNSNIIEKANLYLANFNISITGDTLTKVVSEAGKVIGLFLYEQARSITSNVFKFIISFFFMLLIIYYLLIDGNRLAAFIVQLSPLPDEQDEKLIKKFKDMSSAMLIGNGLGGLIQGTLGGIVFALFGLQSPFLWGVVMGLLAFLPIVGIGVVFVPASIFLFLKGRIAAGVFFIVFYLLLSGIIEYVFKPKLVGRRVQMHTLLVFLSIVSGLKLFGILGIIYGPLIVTAFLTLTDIYKSNYRKYVEPEHSKR